MTVLFCLPAYPVSFCGGPGFFFVDDLHVLALYFEADSVQCDYMVSEIKSG